MVQIANARYEDPASGDMLEISARAVDKDRHGSARFICPDKCCSAELTHYREHIQTYYDPQSGEPYSLKVAAHFQRKKNSPPHDAHCKAVDDYTRLQRYARDSGALSLQHGAFVFNLNIPTDNAPAPLRRKKHRALAPSFNAAAKETTSNERKYGDDVNATEKTGPLSRGLNSVEKLAGLLDASAFDPQYRKSILVRAGARRFTLSDIYKDDPIAFYREEHERAKKDRPPQPVLIQFQPIAIGKYHSPHALTIQGQASPITASNGKAKYAVSVMMHCGNEEIYARVKEQIKEGARSFLLYAASANVNLIELAHKKKEMEIGRQKDNAVFVHVRLDRPEQIIAWSPPQAQLSFDLSKPSRRGRKPAPPSAAVA